MLRNRIALLRSAQQVDEVEYVAGTMGDFASRNESAGTIGVRFDANTVLDVQVGDCAMVRTDGGLPTGGELSVVFCAIVGSRAHDAYTDESDVDRRGVYLPAARVQFSLDGGPAQIVHDADQLCFWKAEKFMRLALKANPTVLETLYSPCIEIASQFVADRIESMKRRGVFLSKRAYDTFIGYADSQFAKMERTRDRGNRFKWKHAMHLIRLLQVGIDVIKTGHLDVVVPEERRKLLHGIKCGELDWPEVKRLRADLVAQFEEAFASTALPDEPDRAAANEFLVELRFALAREAAT